jgi:hypothetical protein
MGKERASELRSIREGFAGGDLRLLRVRSAAYRARLELKGGWEEQDVRSTLDVLRTADLIAQPEASEILVALPNTITAAAMLVDERLRRTVPRAAFGVASYEQGDTAEELLNRVRIATQQAENPEAS